MKKIIHINQHVLRKNLKNGTCEPLITCKTYKDNSYGHQVHIFDEFGQVSASVIYSPNSPIEGGALIWIESHAPVIPVIKDGSSNATGNIIFPESRAVIRVDHAAIRSNLKNQASDPVLQIIDGETHVMAHEAIIGQGLAKIVYSPNKPLSCGARVWLETKLETETVVDENLQSA